MEKLIALQRAQKEVLESFITNYKKDGKDRRTKSYYEKRLKDFQEHWDEFKNRHKEILVMKYSITMTEEKEYDYFKRNVYSTMEEFFISTFAAIEERYKAEFPTKQEKENSYKGAKNADTPKEDNMAVKLPKISLEKFSGDYRRWPAFHDLFRTLVHENMSLSPVQRLQYLKLHLSGEPEQLLRHFQVTNSNYTTAWNLLKERYNNKRVLVNTELKVLLSQATISQELAHGIKSLLDTTTECLQALSNLDVDVKGWDPIIIYQVVQKLPQETHQLWEQTVSKDKELPSWKTRRIPRSWI